MKEEKEKPEPAKAPGFQKGIAMIQEAMGEAHHAIQ